MDANGSIQTSAGETSATRESGKHKSVPPHGMVQATGATKHVLNRTVKGGGVERSIYRCPNCDERGTSSELAAIPCGDKTSDPESPGGICGM